jgi:hypothetical protein
LSKQPRPKLIPLLCQSGEPFLCGFQQQPKALQLEGQSGDLGTSFHKFDSISFVTTEGIEINSDTKVCKLGLEGVATPCTSTTRTSTFSAICSAPFSSAHICLGSQCVTLGPQFA